MQLDIHFWNQKPPPSKSHSSSELDLSVGPLGNESKIYLPRVYENSKDSLYSHTVFQILSDIIKIIFETAKILDLGCADKRSSRLLTKYGLKISNYCGVDQNSEFSPDIESDVKDLSIYYENIDFVPNVVLITDVLEHLDGGTKDIQKFLKDLVQKISCDSKVFITVPQMYRLDRFKLKHLYYPEHKVRLTLEEWQNIVSQDFEIEQQIGIGYISVLPYLIMFLPFYSEHGWTGSVFKKSRNILSKSGKIRQLDYFLSRKSQDNLFACRLANDALFVCRKKAPIE